MSFNLKRRWESVLLEEAIQKIIESEIDFKIEYLKEDGFFVTLKDNKSDNYQIKYLKDFREAVEFLSLKILENYPDCEYSDWFRNRTNAMSYLSNHVIIN